MEQRFYATGKRKTAIARVYLYPAGSGQFQINTKTIEKYFPRKATQRTAAEPLALTKLDKTIDIYANVYGGGESGQADALRLGISRALISYNPELRKPLKAQGFLTRDSRIVERKKAGQKGARARFQYSKR